MPDTLTDAFDRIRPAPRMPAARRRAVNSEALSSGGNVARSKLQAQRDELAREFVGLQWDLGGIAYEMASRDHFRLDVLNQRAAKLQQVDSALGQAERMLRLEREGIAGTCPSCGGVQARGAVFCWQCGEQVTPSSSVTGGSQAVEEPAPSVAEVAAESELPQTTEIPTPLSPIPTEAGQVPGAGTGAPR